MVSYHASPGINTFIRTSWHARQPKQPRYRGPEPWHDQRLQHTLRGYSCMTNDITSRCKSSFHTGPCNYYTCVALATRIISSRNSRDTEGNPWYRLCMMSVTRVPKHIWRSCTCAACACKLTTKYTNTRVHVATLQWRDVSMLCSRSSHNTWVARKYESHRSPCDNMMIALRKNLFPAYSRTTIEEPACT